MWRLKIIIKIILSRVPGGIPFFRKFGIFRNGPMDKAAYALKIFRLHADRVWPGGTLPDNFVALELGPGDSVASALVANAYGAKKIWLVDIEHCASGNVNLYKRMARYFEEAGLPVADIQYADTLEDILNKCNAEYLTDGLKSLMRIPAESVDFIWSHSVLEHIRRDEFASIMRELNRVMTAGGYASHNIDLKDHLGGALNNLRFTEKLWESKFFSTSGFYTNRLQYDDMFEEFTRAGFIVDSYNSGKWSDLPTPKIKMAEQFRHKSDEILKVRTFHVLLARNI